MKITWPLLNKNDIEVKYKNINSMSFLFLGKKKNTDMEILDRAVGPFGWQCGIKDGKNGDIYTVSIYDKDLAQWVSKDGVNFAAACTMWGIGKEIAFLKLQANKFIANPDQAFSVSKISYKSRKITELVICDERQDIVYQIGAKPAQNEVKSVQTDTKTKDPEKINKNQRAELCRQAITIHGNKASNSIKSMLKQMKLEQTYQLSTKDFDAALKLIEDWRPEDGKTSV